MVAGIQLEDLVFMGRPRRGAAAEVAVSRMGLVLGAPDQVTSEQIQQLKDALLAEGVLPQQMHLRWAPKAPSQQELEAAKAAGEPYDPSTQAQLRLVLDVGPLDEKQHASSDWLARLEKLGVVSAEVAQKSRESVAEHTMPLLARMRRDGVAKAIRHEYAVSPIKLIGRMYFIGDLLSFAVGLMNSVGTIKSRGYGDLAFGVACSATGVVMMGWGDRPSAHSPAQALMEKMDKALAGEAAVYPSEAVAPLPERTVSERVDAYLAQNASALGKIGLIVASGGLAMAGVQQKNPIKVVQSFFASVGFPISLLMPPEGVKLEDTSWGKPLAGNATAEAGYRFLQERPNALIAASVVHNMLGFGTSFADIRRAEPQKQAIREQYDAEQYHAKDGRKWWDMPRKELVAHARATGDDAFIDAVANYQMYTRLKMSAPFYAAMVGTYFVTNLLFGLTVEPKKRVHPEELFSLAIERWLRGVDTSLAPETLAKTMQARLQTMAEWLVEQPPVKFALERGQITMMEGQSPAEAVAAAMLERADRMAPLVGRAAEWRLMREVTGMNAAEAELAAMGAEETARIAEEQLAKTSATAHSSADQVIASALPVVNTPELNAVAAMQNRDVAEKTLM